MATETQSVGRGEVADRANRIPEDSADEPWRCKDDPSIDGSAVKVLVYTLGRFSLSISGLPVRAEGKGKQRPLSLLKILVAMGGREVATSQLWEVLWPDSDGDLGARNLAVTLHRLRELLGASSTVLQHDGKLTLNDRVCWVDVWCFERWGNEGAAQLGMDAGAETLLRRALGLYSGHFLSRECEQHWMLAPRLKLKARFERLVAALADHLERHNRRDEAIAVCLSALERDPLNELLYRRLMRCHLGEGEYPSALRVYRQCLEALCKGLAVQPSAETQRLYLKAVRAAALSDAGTAQTSSPVRRHLDLRQASGFAGSREAGQ